MHHSRLSGVIIDCHTADLDGAAQFWSGALGMARLGADGAHYERLDGRARDMTIEVQQVEHASRVHLDIETDDVEAEVARLEALGATRVKAIHTWWVMQAPTGQRFCVVQTKQTLAGLPGVTRWP
jgi:hypothetical protein